MLELVDLKKKISKEEYRKVFPELEIRLGQCQRDARRAGVPVVIAFEGWEAAGKGTVINRLTQALDPRGFKVHPVNAPDEAERLHPWLWRFWRELPAAGTFALFDRSWYGRVLVERVCGVTKKKDWQKAYGEIEQFERQLTDSGVVLVKFWLHIGKGEQKRRFKSIEENPATSWKIGKEEQTQQRDYRKWLAAVEEMLERTGTADAPWTVVEATQARYARVKVFETVLGAVRNELDRRASQPAKKPKPMAAPKTSPRRQRTVLSRVDLSLSLEREPYEERLDALQERLFALEHELYVARVPAVIVFEGWDAAGKGGIIRRLTRGLDPRGYEVVPVAAPSDEEKARHYLWRFWRHLPKAGHVTIFDRSWYGRVLVERVEGFCTRDEWTRGFREINEFEQHVADFGTVIAKFWLHLSSEEQLRRFKAREKTAHKKWKITDEDWRNREQWRKYEIAAVDMLQQTSTTYAPWTIVEADGKLHARIKALETVAQALEKGLKRR